MTSSINRVLVVAVASIAFVALAGWLSFDSLTNPAAGQQLRLSLALAAGTAAIAVALALPLAVILTRLTVLGRRAAWLVIALLLFSPLYVQLAGWDAVGGWTGWYGRSVPQAVLSGLVAAIWVHGVAAVPWATILIAAGLAQVPRQEEELGLVDTIPGSLFTQVLLPRIAPWIVVAGCFAAVTSWQDMTVTNVYLVPTVTEGIYNQIAINSSLTAAGDAVNAAVYLLPALVVSGGLFSMAVVVSQRLLAADFPRNSLAPLHWPNERHQLLATAFVWTVLLFLAGIPLLILVRQAGMQIRLEGNEVTRSWNPLTMLRALRRTIITMRQDFVWTILTAGTAATLSVAIATLLAWWARGGGWRLWLVTLLAAVLLALPGPLVGVLIIRVLNRPEIPGFTWLYDRTLAAPALAQAVRSLPLTLLVVWHGLARFDRNQQEAAALDGCGPWAILWRIVLPQRWRAVISAWGLALAISIGDVANSLLVIPPGMDTVQRRLFGMIHSGVDDQVAAACLLLMGLMTALTSIGVGIFQLQVRR